MIEIIQSVFSIPLYITKRGKLKKKMENEILALGWLPDKISASPFGQKYDFNICEVYYARKKRLEATVSMKQSKIQSNFLGPRF